MPKTKPDQQPLRRHLPQRTCIACRHTGAQKEFIRIVRKPDGQVDVDLSRTVPGRGAYLCRQTECWEEALKKNRVSHALRVGMSQENCQRLLEYSRTLPHGGTFEG